MNPPSYVDQVSQQDLLPSREAEYPIEQDPPWKQLASIVDWRMRTKPTYSSPALPKVEDVQPTRRVLPSPGCSDIDYLHDAIAADMHQPTVPQTPAEKNVLPQCVGGFHLGGADLALCITHYLRPDQVEAPCDVRCINAMRGFDDSALSLSDGPWTWQRIDSARNVCPKDLVLTASVDVKKELPPSPHHRRIDSWTEFETAQALDERKAGVKVEESYPSPMSRFNASSLCQSITASSEAVEDQAWHLFPEISRTGPADEGIEAFLAEPCGWDSGTLARRPSLDVPTHATIAQPDQLLVTQQQPEVELPEPESQRNSDLCASHSPEDVAESQRHVPKSGRDKDKDELLLRLKKSGMRYREILYHGGFTVKESTLRGRFRTLTKGKAQRVRKPKWQPRDVSLLKYLVKLTAQLRLLNLAVQLLAPSLLKPGLSLKTKVPWKKIAQFIIANGGSYEFGAATVSKKWKAIRDDLPPGGPTASRAIINCRD